MLGGSPCIGVIKSIGCESLNRWLLWVESISNHAQGKPSQPGGLLQCASLAWLEGTEIILKDCQTRANRHSKSDFSVRRQADGLLMILLFAHLSDLLVWKLVKQSLGMVKQNKKNIYMWLCWYAVYTND